MSADQSTAEVLADFERDLAAIPELVRQLQAKREQLAELDKSPSKRIRDVEAVRARALLEFEARELELSIEQANNAQRAIAPGIAVECFAMERRLRLAALANVDAARKLVVAKLGLYFSRSDREYVANMTVIVRDEQAFVDRIPNCNLSIGPDGEGENGALVLHPDVKLDDVVPTYRRFEKLLNEAQGRAEALRKEAKA